MPIYCYRCVSCSEEYELTHAPGKWNQECTACHEMTAVVIPARAATTYLKKEEPRPAKPGELTDAYIKEIKQNLKDLKESLKKE